MDAFILAVQSVVDDREAEVRIIISSQERLGGRRRAYRAPTCLLEPAADRCEDGVFIIDDKHASTPLGQIPAQFAAMLQHDSPRRLGLDYLYLAEILTEDCRRPKHGRNSGTFCRDKQIFRQFLSCGPTPDEIRVTTTSAAHVLLTAARPGQSGDDPDSRHLALHSHEVSPSRSTSTQY